MLFSLLGIAVVVYLLILLGMFVFQRKLMYIPEKTILEPEHYGVQNTRIIPLVSEDKTEIEAWYLEATKPSLPLIVYYHGNAGHIGDRMAKISHFVAAGFGVLAVSYRGYGKSKGAPTEMGLYADARTALLHALDTLEIPPERIVLYGESLGSGIATHMAKDMADKHTPVAGLILEAPYTSVARRSQEMYPFIPALYLVKDKFHSIDKIAGIHCPVMIFHGEKDTVIPIHHGRALLEKAHEPKRGVFFDEVDHTAFDYPTLAKHLLEFAEEHKLVLA
jgi:fermentation-respiration switch protein FrsA (DUF1100 family)